MFEVTADGATVTFDTCLSRFSTSVRVVEVDRNGATVGTVFPTAPRTINLGESLTSRLTCSSLLHYLPRRVVIGGSQQMNLRVGRV